MKEQNAPLWRNGQIPSSNASDDPPQVQDQSIQHAKKQNSNSAKHKRSH